MGEGEALDILAKEFHLVNILELLSSVAATESSLLLETPASLSNPRHYTLLSGFLYHCQLLLSIFG